LSTGANVNIYMIHGGTSFGFENGANTGDESDPFSIEPTSYDYDSPISEAGDLTYKFEAFQKVISKYVPIPPIQV
jgi:beta-galactosidase